MKRIFTTAMLLSGVIAFAQDGNVGINTETPEATLEINPNVDNSLETAKTNEGILIPRISKTRIANIDDAKLRTGTLVFVNNTDYTSRPANTKVENITIQGFYFYDGNTWQPLQKPTPKFDYILSTNGNVLTLWFDKYKNTIDMTKYADMSGVTHIAGRLLESSQVKKFVMKEGIITIGEYAFSNNPDMAINLPNSITTIEPGAFYKSNTITTLNLPNVIRVGSVSAPLSSGNTEGSFAYNTALTSISLPSAVVIGNSAFAYNTALTSISLPNATTIADNAFVGNTALTSISLPNVVEIGSGAFADNIALTNVNLPNVTRIFSSAFRKTSITNISLPNVTQIDDHAFDENTSLLNVELPNVEKIESYAIAGAPGLNVLIGSKIKELDFLFLMYPQHSVTITIQATTPPRFVNNLEFTRLMNTSGIIFKVPSASVQAYRTAWAGLVDASKIIGY